jgi:ABC-type oligopeptide transport system substrate-binding subunit
MMTRDVARFMVHVVHVAFAATAVLAAATLADAPQVSGTAWASERPRYGGRADVAVSDPMLVIDPARASSMAERALGRLIYETLIEGSEGRRPLPALAVEWEAGADSTVWTLRLDDGVRFHDGSRLTAEDAAYSLLRIARRAGPNPYRWPLRNLSSVEARGDEIVLRFDRPEPRALLMLSCPGLAVMKAPESAASQAGFSYDSAPPGTGPFEIPRDVDPGAPGLGTSGPMPGARTREARDGGTGRSRSDGSSGFQLVAFEGHRLGRPFLDALNWRFSDFEDAVIDLQAGALEMAVGFPSPAAGALGGGASGARRQLISSSHWVYLACNPSGALRERSSRLRALSAVDRRSMIRSIVGSGGGVAYSLLPEEPSGDGLWREKSPRVEAPGGASARASERATAARTPPEESTPTLTLLAPRWHKTAGEVADRIQVDLMAAGFSVSLRKLGRSEMTYKLAAGEFDLLVGLWEPDRWLSERGWLLSHFWETQIAPVPALAAALGAAGGGAESVPAALEEKLEEDCLLLPLFHLDTAVLIRRGFVAEPGRDGLPDMSWSWIDGPGR